VALVGALAFAQLAAKFRMISAIWDQDLADAIRYISQTARRAFLMMWDGFDSTVIERFLRQHPPTLTT
jgi:hypothetical protein